MAHKITALLVGFSFTIRGGLAAVLLGPEPTAAIRIQEAIKVPLAPDNAAITPAPELMELHRRQQSTVRYLLAPDETCGFDGKGSALACGSGLRCGFISASVSSLPARQHCCPASGCPANAVRRTACRDQTATCDSVCQSNLAIMKCTSSSFPYCHTVYYVASTIIGFQCRASTFAGTPGLLRTTLSGGPARTYVSSIATITGAVSIRLTTEKGSTITITTTTNPEPDSSLSSNIRDPNNGRNNEERPEPNNTGAIVGGAVGGAAVLAISALAGVLFFRRRQRDKNRGETRGGQAVPMLEARGAQGLPDYNPVSPSYQASSHPGSPGFATGTLSTVSAPQSPGIGHANKASLLVAGQNSQHRLSEVDGGAGSHVHELPAH